MTEFTIIGNLKEVHIEDNCVVLQEGKNEYEVFISKANDLIKEFESIPINSRVKLRGIIIIGTESKQPMLISNSAYVLLGKEK